ncbi:MAG: alkaline shock response membrane anchor protein AmaP [Candidatus Omnitrophica bacterium]|nr:alkaline shock response membrane anchor protein AmaP [Candidatus Omnitrophota bacterium]
MTVLKTVWVLFWTLLCAAVGVGCVAAFSGWISPEALAQQVEYILGTTDGRFFVLAVGLGLILISLGYAQISLNRLQNSQVITFANQSGPVSVSVNAIQEHIKRSTALMQEVKDLKIEIRAGRKKIYVTAKAALWADSDLPSASRNVQDVISNEIRQALGEETAVRVAVRVTRIARRAGAEAQRAGGSTFQGTFEYGEGLEEQAV